MTARGRLLSLCRIDEAREALAYRRRSDSTVRVRSGHGSGGRAREVGEARANIPPRSFHICMTHYPSISLLAIPGQVSALKVALVGCDYASLSSGSGVCGLGSLLGGRAWDRGSIPWRYRTRPI